MRTTMIATSLSALLLLAGCGGDPEPAAATSALDQDATDQDATDQADPADTAAATDDTAGAGAADDPEHTSRVAASIEVALELTADVEDPMADPCDDPVVDAVLQAAVTGIEDDIDDPVAYGGAGRLETDEEIAATCRFGEVEVTDDSGTAGTEPAVEVRWSKNSPVADMIMTAGDAVTTPNGAPAAVTDRYGDDDSYHQQTSISTAGGGNAIIVNSTMEWMTEDRLLEVLDAVLELGS